MPGMKEAKTVVSTIFFADMKPPSFSDHIRLPAWFPVGWRCNKDLPGGWNLDSGDEDDYNEDDVNHEIDDVYVDNNAIEANFDNLDNRQSCLSVCSGQIM